MDDLVSIIMPTYNSANYIEASVQSVINQSYSCWELLIVDDCSTDQTVSIIKKYQDVRIHYIRNSKNSGAAYSRNQALKVASGKWIAFLDSDDLWKCDKLERQIAFMKKNNYHISYTKYEEISVDGSPQNIIVGGPTVVSKMSIFNYCWMGCLTVMYDREFIGQVQIVNIAKNNDYALWLKICKKANCYLLDEVLAEYRKGRSGSISTHSYGQLIKWHYRVFRLSEQQGIMRSSINTMRNLIFGVIKKIRYCKKYE